MALSSFNKIFAVFAIISASCGFILFGLPTPKYGVACVTLSLFFSFLWFVTLFGEDVSEDKQREKQTNK